MTSSRCDAWCLNEAGARFQCNRPAKHKRGSWDLCGVHNRAEKVLVRPDYSTRIILEREAVGE